MTELKSFDSIHIHRDDVFNPSESLYIEASAGTGKTYTILQIVARMVLDGTPLSKILIVTYTEKAAGELKNRIRINFENILRNGELVQGGERMLSKEEMLLFQTALDDVDVAQIFTIHSFCQKTLNSYAYDAWRSFDMEMVSDKLVQSITLEWIRDKWPEITEYANLLCNCNDDNEMSCSGVTKTVEKIEKILIDAIPKFYMSNDGKCDDKIVSLVIDDCPMNDDEKNMIKAENIDDLKKIPEFKSIYENLKQKEDEYWNPNAKASSKPHKISELIETLDNYRCGKNLYNGNVFRKNQFSEDREQIAAFKEKLSNAFKKVNKYREYCINYFVYKQIPELYQAWKYEKMRNKLESYQDMIDGVYQAVMNDECGLKEKLRETYQYAIIDEFQDTNQMQWDIFKKVFLNVPEHAIFVVGDPKQSIYSFQRADVNVYREAIAEIGNGRCLDTNFRSTKTIIDACNAIFEGVYFEGGDVSFSPSKSTLKKCRAVFDGQETAPIWLVSLDSAESNSKKKEQIFAELAGEKLVECCSFQEDGKTRLQVFDKDSPSKLRNVRFSDFAILAYKKSEFSSIEKVLTKLGIPFLRYKDDNLFAGRECMEWIALFNAINANDFSAMNRRILNELLMTDFFAPVEYPEQKERCFSRLMTADDVYYDDPLCMERLCLSRWHALARKSRWAELLECIYRDTEIEKRLSDLSKLQEISKIRQIGNYCIDYLYAKKCSIEDLVKHLNGIRKNDKSDDPDGNLVARGSDLDAVQIMTIHASKGLEFPVVIGVGGNSMGGKNADGPFLYHLESSCEGVRKKLVLGFGENSKQMRHKEELEEAKRLYYVAYTRASSLMILPLYCENENSSEKSKDSMNSDEMSFLKKSLKNLLDYNQSLCCLCTQSTDNDKLKKLVSDILNHHRMENEQLISSSDLDSGTTKQQQMHRIAALQRNVGKHCLIQHSYSSLSKKVKIVDVYETSDFINDLSVAGNDGICSERYGENNDDAISYCLPEPNVDIHPKPVMHIHDYCMISVDEDDSYPRGAMLGNAVHEIFENADFDAFGHKKTSQELEQLIETCFMRYGLNVRMHRNWIDRTASMVWNTFNAKLPEIHGNSDTGNAFVLKELEPDTHFAEVEFMLPGVMHDLCDCSKESGADLGEYFSKGFMDLMFVRKDENGNERYSILDWKTDLMESESYSNPQKLKQKVDVDYAVQRVLYAYCLIQWLSGFYHLSPKEVFDAHFGGIYYAFVRGCSAGTSNGIYAQTWDCYETLARGYQAIRSLMFSSKTEE